MRSLASEPLPPAADVRDEMLRHLRAIACDLTADSRARVAAARAVILAVDATNDPMAELRKRLSTPRAMREWALGIVASMDREIAAEAREGLASPTPPAKAEDDEPQ